MATQIEAAVGELEGMPRAESTVVTVVLIRCNTSAIAIADSGFSASPRAVMAVVDKVHARVAAAITASR
jgi:hypothetical protein